MRMEKRMGAKNSDALFGTGGSNSVSPLLLFRYIRKSLRSILLSQRTPW